MLVLSRRKDESIMIGDNVEITIVGILRGKVRLGITAPKKIPVLFFLFLNGGDLSKRKFLPFC